MSNQSYRPVAQPYISNDGQTMFESPEMIQSSWRTSSGGYNHDAYGIEMQQSPPALPHRPSQISFASNENFQREGMTPTPIEKRPLMPHQSTSRDSTMTTASIKAKTGKQLRHLLIGSSFRWILSLALCAAWVVTTRIVVREEAVSEFKKRLYNAITTGIGLCLGLNIASAFKDMALNMRWPILARGERSLNELDLILRADSLMELSKLVFSTRKPGIILAAALWLLINIAAQAGIAAVSLTYGFETDATSAMLNFGNVTIADMQQFYPLGTSTLEVIPIGLSEGYEDASFSAHQYGSMAQAFGWNETTELPNHGRRVLLQDGLVFYNNKTEVQTYVFYDTSDSSSSSTSLSVFSQRSIDVTWGCDSYQITERGNGSYSDPVATDVGTIFVSQSLPGSTTFFHNENTTCTNDTSRCTVIEVFETAADTSKYKPWYYKCEITLGKTNNDTHNLSFVSDSMALFATASIAQGGFVGAFPDGSGVLQDAQIIPQSSYFGAPMDGEVGPGRTMGWLIAYFAIGALGVAAIYNPSKSYSGQTPTQGQQLVVGHALWFLGILFLLLLTQLILIIIVAIWANRVKVQEDSPLNMAVMMRPIADKLDNIPHDKGRETKAFKKAKRKIKAQYVRDPGSGVWSFVMRDPRGSTTSTVRSSTG